MTTQNVKKSQADLTLAYHNHQKELILYALSKTQDRDMSEDLIQQTFIKTWTYLVKQGKIDLMKAFLYHVLKNLIVDQYRKPKTISLDALLSKGFEAKVGDPERLVNIIDGKAAFSLIKNLPEKYQRVMEMRYARDLSLKEMSIITGQSINAMAVQSHRGLLKLKLLYDHASA
ncbi:MAG: RNA polymerase sigma factor [Patescibacteria group bacterium]|jgi:RNA polymerase sigma-70 factor (ECF subfamily)